MEYCKHCKERTATVYNGYMVGFCMKCERRRPYEPVLVAFQCRECGMMTDESRPGQIYCNDCETSVRK